MVVEPEATPCTIPVLPTVAVDVLALLHVPPVVPEASLNTVFAAGHTVIVPAIVPATGTAFIVTTAVAADVPQPLVTA